MSGVKKEEVQKEEVQKEEVQKKELVPVFLIKTKEKKDDYFCAINGKSYQIKRGEQVMVPKAVDIRIRWTR